LSYSHRRNFIIAIAEGERRGVPDIGISSCEYLRSGLKFRSQRPHPVSAKNAETRVGHPKSLTSNPAVAACDLSAEYDYRDSEQDEGDVSRFAQAGEFFWRDCRRHHVD